jgi:ABC-type dipeptide/oligopeptide/nickel transport system ATPase subunit
VEKEKGGKAVLMITEERVAIMIAAAIKGLASAEALQVLVTGAELDEKLSAMVSKDQLQLQFAELAAGFNPEQRCREIITELFDEFMAAAHQGPVSLSLPVDGDPAGQAPLDPDWLEGLIFRDATQERRMVEGRPKIVATQIERPLRPSDVLAYRVTDDQVYLSTRDGKKHTVDI